jgi:hypothetical protein
MHHSFTRGRYRLLAERVPAGHGRQSLFTLLFQEGKGWGWQRIAVGTADNIRRACGRGRGR